MAGTTKTAEPAKPSVPAAAFNIPTQLTLLRLALSIVLFVLMGFEQYFASMIVFLVAATTDWLDGYLARKWGLVTVLGRILDPFVDKIIICGTFIFLAAIPQSHLTAWMAVVVVGRELLVTALRGYLEQHGTDFSAAMSGKLKMVLQCAAAAVCLYYLSRLRDPDSAQDLTTLKWIAIGTIWAAVLLTIYSGVEYVVAAVRLLRA